MSDRISPTARYTGYVWYRNGLAPKALVQPGAAGLFGLVQPWMWLGAPFVGGTTLERMLVKRHRVIDHLLEQAIEAGRVGQVLELAAGFTARGLRFAERYPALRYIETDLPRQLERKQRAVEGLGPANLAFRPLDVFAEGGPDSLQAAFDSLDPEQGVAVITEGLVNYFDTPAVEGLWARIAAGLGAFPQGVYLSDLRLAQTARSHAVVRIFMSGLSAFARGRVHAHFGGVEQAHSALARAGFGQPAVHRPAAFRDALGLPSGADLLALVEAWA